MVSFVFVYWKPFSKLVGDIILQLNSSDEHNGKAS